MIRIFSQFVSVKFFVLMQIEALLILSSFAAAAKLWFWNDPTGFAIQTGLPGFAVQCLIQMVLLQLCFYCNDLYGSDRGRGLLDQLVRLVQSIGALCILTGLLYYAIPLLPIGREVLALGLSLVLVVAFLTRWTLDKAWQAATPPRQVLILGTGSIAKAVAAEINRRDDLNLNLCAFASKDPDAVGSEPALGRPVVGLAAIQEAVRRFNVSQIVVALEDRRGNLPVADLVRLRLEGLTVGDAHEFLAALTGRIRLDAISPSWFVFSQGFRRSKVSLSWKRAIDIILALAAVTISMPLIALSVLAVWLESGGPILYRQTRVGLRGKPFQLLKFRSMRADAEANGEAQWARINDPRATPVGRILRKYRLDELPQCWNVLRGEMSFVGPRPERPPFVGVLREAIPYYDERHSVRPGMTGWAQVQYPYGATIEEAARKLEYDLFYLKNMSFAFDCAIIFKTVRIVLLGWGSR